MEKISFKTIELARLSRGYTQKDLASFLPINQSSLSKIEKGLLSISPSILQNISNTLNYPIKFFYRKPNQTPISSFYFRKRASIPQKKLDKIFADVNIILKSIDLLLEDIDLLEFAKYSFDLSEGWTPESVAIRVREVFKIPNGPVKNVFKLLEDHGIIIFLYNSDEIKFDGLTAYTDKGYPVIFLNRNLSNDRLRFTLIHEFFHLIMHIPCNVEPWRDVEEEANAATAEFLLPAKECLSDLASLSYNDLTVLKAYWGVSKAAIIHRARMLNLISESSYKYLMIELGRRNERKVENGYVEIDEPQILTNVIELLKNELKYTNEEISENLSLSFSDYTTFFDNKNPIKIKLRALKNAI